MKNRPSVLKKTVGNYQKVRWDPTIFVAEDTGGTPTKNFVGIGPVVLAATAHNLMYFVAEDTEEVDGHPPRKISLGSVR